MFDSFLILRIVIFGGILVSFFIFFIAFLFFLKLYYLLLYNYLFNNSCFIYNDIFFLKIPIFLGFFNKFSIEFFGFIFIILAYIIGFLSLLALDIQFFWKNIRFMFTCNLLIISIYLFTIANDILLLFLFYECILIPSFLFIYFVSSYKRGIQASLFFLI
jgi:formate hydrogenlyase subunit 3/multisubunit Na+/H+ antiporter MnhD subunit